VLVELAPTVLFAGESQDKNEQRQGQKGNHRAPT
jgi:hypothetical protein